VHLTFHIVSLHAVASELCCVCHLDRGGDSGGHMSPCSHMRTESSATTLRSCGAFHACAKPQAEMEFRQTSGTTQIWCCRTWCFIYHRPNAHHASVSAVAIAGCVVTYLVSPQRQSLGFRDAGRHIQACRPKRPCSSTRTRKCVAPRAFQVCH